LKGDAAAEWNRIVRELVRAKAIAKLDLAALASYCVAWSALRQAEELVAKLNGNTIMDSGDGKKKPHPAIIMRRNALAELRAWARELGLSPNARGQIITPAPGDEHADAMGDLLD
jgi:P27 family predicted phage terminase small subunit